jgi:diguanylate cyclase (GGDEF)-like protein
MMPPPADKQMAVIADAVLEVLREVAESGRGLSRDLLAARLVDRREFAGLRPSEAPPAGAAADLSARETARLEALQRQLETIRQHKEKLLVRVQELEHREAASSHFFRRTVGLLAQQLGQLESPPLQGALDRLKQLALANAPILELETAFADFKVALIRSQPDVPVSPAPRRDAAGYSLGRFLKGEKPEDVRPALETAFLNQFKEIAQSIIAELKLHLDRDYLQRVQAVEARLRQAESLEAALGTRQALIALVKDYAGHLSREREQAASFIQEIGKRLGDMESLVFDSLSQAREAQRAHDGFRTGLETQFEALEGHVNFSSTLEELKQTVLSKLKTISGALAEQRRQDQRQLALVDGQMVGLEKEFDHLRGEIVTARQRAESLEAELLIDPLTGIYNRRAYERRIGEEFQRFLRYGQAFAIVLFDVDHFKQVNDRFGHAIGDRCLKEICLRLGPMLRESDFFCRIGGEEFILLLPATSPKAATAVAEKLRREIAATQFVCKDQTFTVTISFGVTAITAEDRDPLSLFNRVDQAMYTAKTQGRNRVAVL